MTDLVREVRKTIAEHGLLVPGETLVLGVSGGADSLCMLHVLSELADECGVSLHVAHLEHGIRGTESEADAHFVAETSAGLGLPFTVEHADVPGLAREEGIAVEEAARQARYAFLGRVARSLGSRSVAVAHNADDQVETVLMHILRGAGLAGLRGMRPLAWMDELRLGEPAPAEGVASGERIRLVRPLLDVPRTDIEAYCRAHRLSPRYDRSNLDTTYFRNRLRLELLPTLETYNPNIRQVLRRMASAISADYDLLRDVLLAVWPMVVRSETDEAIVYDLEALSRQPLGGQRSLLREGVHRLRRSLRNIGFQHIEGAVRLVKEGVTGSKATLPRGLMLVRGYDQVVLAPEGYGVPRAEGPRVSREIFLSVPATLTLPEGGWRLRTEVLGRESLPTDWDQASHALVAYFDLDRLGGPHTLRPRRAGDRLTPLGLGHRQKVSDLMINCKIPRGERDSVPLLLCGTEVVWVVGFRQDALHAVSEETGRVLRVSFERIDPCEVSAS